MEQHTKQFSSAQYEDARVRLYLSQKQTLDTFLANGAISQAQYEKSLGDLTEKMGMQKLTCPGK